ncbi:MAG: AAA family ATPase [Planctomycetota bacterium]|nr:AAA family ATPase [Planctomycetota bacterium]
MRTIAIVNQKGGCGKTTTAINLGACLGRLGRRTLLIDLDPQGHCAAGLGIPEQQIEFGTSDLLLQASSDNPPEQRFWRAAASLDLVPSRVRLAGLEAPGSPFAQQPDREHRLADALRPLADRFDVCLLDCPPSIGLLTFNALVAADLVLVPVETAYFSLQGAARQLKTVRAISRRLDTRIRCSVLPTLHEPGLAVAADLLNELKRQFGKRLMPVVVHRDPALREAASFGRPVCVHAPHSQATRDYAALASVLIETESLPANADEEDWSDVDASTPPRRPTHASHLAHSNTAHPEPENTDIPGTDKNDLYTPNSNAILTTPSQFSSPFGSSFTGEVVVTLDDRHVHSLQPRRFPAQTAQAEPAKPAEPKHPAPNRAEELARRTIACPPSLPLASRIEPRPGRPVFGRTLTNKGVEFVQPGALGRRVAIAGPFSNWKPIDLFHDTEAETHAIRLALPPGRHEYRLIVDGTWTADPYNTDWILSEFGEPHSLVEVPVNDAPMQKADMRCGAD